jgi:rhamnogalacturonan endolyase
LSADVIGDWREEVIWRCGTTIRVYTTTALSTDRLYTLMHDPQYREAIAWQNSAYNQPPHPSFHLGAEWRPRRIRTFTYAERLRWRLAMSY